MCDLNELLEKEVRTPNGISGILKKIDGDMAEIYANNEGLNKKDFTTYIIPKEQIILKMLKTLNETPKDIVG